MHVGYTGYGARRLLDPRLRVLFSAQRHAEGAESIHERIEPR
jgi:hypothetical protein